MESTLRDYVSKVVPGALSRLSEWSSITLVVGNEAGDLDSVVSAVTLAWHMHSCLSQEEPRNAGKCVLPLMSFEREDWELKTEVLEAFETTLSLPVRNVLCMSDVDWAAFDWKRCRVVLVDHNVVNTPGMRCFEERVAEIYDHHQMERANADQLQVCLVRKVGSCSTLIAGKIFQERIDIKDEDFLTLVRATILVDTSNLSPVAKKVTPDDVQMLDTIEEAMKKYSIQALSREAAFRKLEKAKFNVDHFSSCMLMRKDRKVINLSNGSQVSVSTIPKFSCSELIARPGFVQDVETFIDKGKLELAILLGDGFMLVAPAHSCDELSRQVREHVMKCGRDSLGLEFHAEVSKMDWYIRHLPSVTRKQILPFLKQVMQ